MEKLLESALIGQKSQLISELPQISRNYKKLCKNSQEFLQKIFSLIFATTSQQNEAKMSQKERTELSGGSSRPATSHTD